MPKKRVGFSYNISIKKIKEYRAMPLEKRLTWLYQVNVLRKAYPKELTALQDKFREGEI